MAYHVSQVRANAGGLYVFAPGRWGVLGVTLTNSDDQPADVLCATYFGDRTDLQYGRRYRLPARSRLHTWHPILIPEGEVFTGGQIPFHTIVAPVSPDGDVLIEDDIGNAQLDSTIRTTRQTPITGVIDRFDPRERGPRPAGAGPFDAVSTARVSQGYPRQIAHLNERQLPPDPTGLDSLDSLVISEPLQLMDAGALDAIRAWVADGGRLWIMLDRVGAELPAALVGDTFACEVVDRVTLTHLRIERSRQSPVESVQENDYEEPVTLLRVVVDGARVTHVVNGWPAVLLFPYGQGDVLLTTLGVGGLMRPRTPYDAMPPAGIEPTNFAPEPILEDLAAEFIRPRDPVPLPSETLERHVTSTIGYDVPSRRYVVGLLGLGCSVMIVLSIRLVRRGRLERLALYGPALGAVVALALGAAGYSSRRAVSVSQGFLQVVRPVMGTDDVRVSGAAATLSVQSGTATVVGSNGGWLTPDMSGMEGSVRRMIWSDLDQWSWERLPKLPGLRTASFASGSRQAVRTQVVASFDEQGVTGRLRVPEGLAPSDLMLVTPTGRIAVHFDGDRLTARGGDVMAPGQYVADGLLDDEQVRRRELLVELLGSEEFGFPRAPMLLAWTGPWTSGVGLGEDGAAPVGSALLAVPVTFQRPEANTRILLPSPLLPYREYQGPDGRMPVGFYTYRTRRWTPKAQPSMTWIWVQVPQDLAPLALREVRIVVRVAGPVGRLEIAGFDGEKVTPAASWTDPVGTLEATISEESLLQTNEYHQLPLRISGGDPTRPELTRPEGGGQSYWRIESLEVEILADVEPLTQLVDAPVE